MSTKPAVATAFRDQIYAILIVVAVIMVLMYPWIVWGVCPGGDQAIHLHYFHAFNAQVRGGEFYPRWLVGSNYGAGSPIFFLQYPLPFFMASAIHKVLALPPTPSGESHALGLVFVLEAIFFIVAAYLWCSRFALPRHAAIAAALGFTLPYVLWIDFYTRIAVGECLAFGCMALALYFAEFLDSRPQSAVAGIAFAFGLLFLSHLFSVVMFAPFFLAYVSFRWRTPGSILRIRNATLGIFLGAGLTAFYLLPFLSHERFFNTTGFSNQPGGILNFNTNLFPINSIVLGDFPSGWWFLNWINRGMALLIASIGALHLSSFRRLESWKKVLIFLSIFSILAISLAPYVMGAVIPPPGDAVAEAIFSYRSHIFGFVMLSFEIVICLFLVLRLYEKVLGQFFFASCLLSFLLTTRFTALIWHHLSFLKELQFPWRFMGGFSVFEMGLIALAFSSVTHRQDGRIHRAIVVALLFLPSVALSAIAWQGPAKFLHRLPDKPTAFVDLALPIYVHTNQLFGHINPWPGDTGSIDTAVVHGSGKADLQTVSPRKRVLFADCSDACDIRLNLIYFPLWRAIDSSTGPATLRASRDTGLAHISLSPGEHKVVIELPPDRAELYSPWVSLISAFLLSGLCLHSFFAKPNSPEPSVSSGLA